MIERYAAGPEANEARLVVQPNRALSPRQVRIAFALIATGSVLVSILGWWQGNRFAPGFTLLALLGLGLALFWANRAGLDAEVIAVTPQRLAIRRLPGLEDAFAAPVAWVRLDAAGDHLAVASGSNRIEVGAFLGVQERATLARQIAVLLRWARNANRRSPQRPAGMKTGSE